MEHWTLDRGGILMKDNTTRRDFFKNSGIATATGLGLMIAKPEIVRGSQANSALSVGLIGCGRRGVAISGIFAKNEFAKIAAICDIYDDQIKEASQKFSGARTFKNYHDLEKPAGEDAAGCRRVIEAAKKADKTKRISVDFQQRYGKDYRKVHEIVKSGELGGIKQIRASWLGGPTPIRTGHPASEEKMRNWLFYREYSGDILIEQDCHNIDVVNWFMGTHPVKAFGYGGRQVRTDIGNVMDNLTATYKFANGVVFGYDANQMSQGGFSDVSETFICEKGAINVSRKGYKLYNSKNRYAPPQEVVTKYDITEDAVNDFIDGARNGRLENAAFTAAESTLTAIMAREAIYKEKEMNFEAIAKS
jgi:myo-inositol 2-dehydrogenase/D-chiro-inositol 1-dehydrogenase